MDIWDISQRDLIALLNYGKKQNLCLFETLEKLSVIASHEVAKQSALVEGEIAAVALLPRNDNVVFVSDKTKEAITKFVSMVHRHQELIPKETGGQILYFFLEASGLLKSIVNFEEKRAQNISKFFDKLKTFEAVNSDAGVFAIVDYLNLAMEMGESPTASEIDWSANNAVNILTVHSAKGLEFPVVFLTNLVEGRFPTRERKEQIPVPDELIKDTLPTGDFHLEEERRLFYVGMTRAKQKLFFSAANFYGEGKRERKLSPFVVEAGIENSKPKIPNQKQIPLFEWTKPEEKISEKSQTKIDYLSYSAIQSFKDCPLHFKLRHILRIPTPTTAPLSMGNSIHLALRDYHRDGGNILESLGKNWIMEGYNSKQHEQEALEKAKKFLTEYLDTEIHKNARPLFLEQPFTLRVDPTLKIGGKIDRVDDLGGGLIEIIDYKTGANVPSQKDIDLDLQMTIYALAASDPGVLGREIEKVKLSFYFFDTASKITTVRTKEQLEEARKELLRIRDEIQKSDFACSHSMWCENCEFKMLCG